MIQLLYTAILGEAAVILILLFKTPLRKFTILFLDRVKRDRGPVVVKTIAATVAVVLISDLYSMVKIQAHAIEAAATNPTDQVLMARCMLESSLMGFVLFLGLMIDRLHHYIRELRLLRKTMEAAKKQNRVSDDGKNGIAEQMKVLGEENATLKAKIKILEAKCRTEGGEGKGKGKDA